MNQAKVPKPMPLVVSNEIHENHGKVDHARSIHCFKNVDNESEEEPIQYKDDYGDDDLENWLNNYNKIKVHNNACLAMSPMNCVPQ